MKKFIVLLSVCFLIANIVIGIMLTSFNTFNVVLGSISIIISSIFLLIVNILNLKEGYRFSLLFLFSICGILQYVLSVLSPNQFSDNWYLISVFLITIVEIALLITTNAVSKKTTA